jgi:4-hydroxy-2-oxoheptanedioate aldolase
MNKFFKKKLKKKLFLQGIWSIIPSNVVTEILSLSGLDFVILDMEHGNFSKEDIKNSIIACNLHKCSALVRVPIFDLSNIQSALDSGCSGIVFPKISSKQDALKAVSLCEFSPKGNRGFNPFTRFNNYNLFEQDLYKKNQESILKIAIVETREGIENLEEILSVDEIDVIYLGAYDLSKEYNFKSLNNKNFLNIIDSSLKKINFFGKISGLMINNEIYLNLAKKYKAQFLVHSVDSEIIGNAIKNILNIRK